MEGHSEEWGPLLALVPLLREAPTARERGGEGREKWKIECRVGGMKVNKYLKN